MDNWCTKESFTVHRWLKLAPNGDGKKTRSKKDIRISHHAKMLRLLHSLLHSCNTQNHRIIAHSTSPVKSKMVLIANSKASVCFRKMSQSRCRSRQTPADVPTKRVATAAALLSPEPGRERVAYFNSGRATEPDSVIRSKGP